ncbi:hypothetical protein F8388_018488 [Cannabis sativa]|uniref:Ubiquitin-like protease family profile domain-containing protein n=1 Tax=Cannabis sativa TaxID=3483 RepID=A0A7J6G4U8_CANSA|nr:hypothetical protein F8388_018488 [Cannabis sativa]
MSSAVVCSEYLVGVVTVFTPVFATMFYTMDKSLDTIVYVKKRKRSDVSKDTIPYVDPGVQQQDQVNVDHSDDDFVQHNESGTSSKVPVEKKIQPTVRETRGRKKKATVVDSDVPNLPVRRTKRALVKCVASKGPSPSIPEESDVYLKMKLEHCFASKLQIWNNLWVIEELNENLTPSQKALFLTTPFSQFLKMSNVKWHIDLPHLALVREVHQEREDLEKWFLIRDRVVCFGLEEFVLIKGLSPEGSSDLNEFKQNMSFKKKMFPDLTIKVIQEQVRARFLSGEFDDDVDAVKMEIVYLLSHYLYGYENGKRVDNELFGFVDGDFSELRNIAFGKLLRDRSFHYMNLAFKDCDNIYYKIEKAKEEKDKFYSFKFQGFPFAFLIWLFEILPSLSPNYCKTIANTYPRMLNWETTYKKKTGGYSKLVSEATVKDFYPVGRELKKSILQNLKFEPVYLPKKPRGFDGKFSKLDKALDEFNIKFDEVIELLKSKKGSSVPKDFEENVEDSCSENQNVGGNDDELPDPLSPEVFFSFKTVVSKSEVPEYDDDEGGLQLSLVREDKVHSGLGEGRDEGDSASPAVDDEVEVLDVLPLQSSVAVKRQTKPRLHCRSPFVNEFGSSEPKVQNKKDKEPSSELAFDPKELFPFIKEIGKITGTEDCGEYVKWIEGARLLKKKNNEKIAGDINPPFDFSIAQIDDKSWFVILQTCGKELFDLHLNVALYYLRKSILYDVSVNKRVTTTCTYFDATIKGVYADFIKAKHDPSVIKYDNMVTDYFLGQYNFCFQPWIGVNDVVGPCHVGLQQHWIFLHFNILRRKIFVFNSMKNTKTNQKKILPDLLAYCELLPYFLDFLNFYDGRNDINLESGPYVVPKDTPIAYEFVDKLPTQSRSDCGVFLIKYGDLFIRGQD